MRARGVPSPDEWDAVVLTFAEPVRETPSNFNRKIEYPKYGVDECLGVCRDFAHLTVTLCRCLNIPARYVNGYLGDIGIPRDPAQWTLTRGLRCL
jgi:transglutaminase-like putative cysteine protease